MAYQDLLKDTSASYEDGNYFIVTISDLTPGQIYPLEFKWLYKDGTVSDDWSAVKTITASPESVPVAPATSAFDVSYYQGIITVKWSGKDSNGNNYSSSLDKVNVYLQRNDEAPLVYILKGTIPIGGGSLSIPVVPAEYSVKLRTASKTGLESGFSSSVVVTAKATPPTNVSAISPAWSGTDFTLSFSSDKSAAGNEQLAGYLITLTGSSTSYTIQMAPSAGTTQKFSLSLAENRAIFGVVQPSLSGSISTIDVYGNIGTPVTFAAHEYINNFAAPSISKTAISNGYSVAYTAPTDSTYDHIEIEEIESTSSTAPTSGYSTIFSGKTNPAVVVVPNTNKRWIRARFFDNLGLHSGYGTAIDVTPLVPVVADTVGPANVASVTTVSGIDTSGYLGFNGFITVTWPAVSDSSLRGYRIRFSNDGGATYSYVNSPGAGTSYKLAGLSVGSTYKIAVATYDEYNNTSSSYVSATDVTISGTPATALTVTAGQMQIGYGVGGATSNRGLYLDSSNFWYLNALNSAVLRVGGAANNYLYWNGTSFTIDGNLIARQGSFSGNVAIASGGSLSSGTVTAGALVGAGYILNSTGLTFNSSSVNGITSINGTTGLFTTASANIGGWLVGSTSISKTSSSGTITLDSANALINLTSSAYTAGIGTPNTNSSTDIVFWAGGSRGTAANFYVQANGTVVMKSATITGYATSTQLSTKIDASQVNANVTSISGGVITTGTIQSSGYSGVTDGSTYSSVGTAFNLTNGTITSKQFRIDTSGNAKFKGDITGASGTFSGTVSGATITATDGTNTLTISSNGAISNSSGSFSVSAAGVLQASNAVISGSITANAIAAGTDISGVTGTFSGRVSINTATDTSAYFDSGGSLSGVTGLVVGSIGFKNTSIGGWTSHCYPYMPGSPNIDLGTAAFRWNDVRTSGRVFMGHGGSDTITNITGQQPYTVFLSNGRIYANTLGTGSGTGLVQDASGYLRVSSSSRRYKENISEILNVGYLDAVNLLKPVKFSYKAQEQDIDATPGYNPIRPIMTGLIAEDVEQIEILKDLVNYNSIGEVEGLAYDRLTAVLTLAIQEISNKINNINERLDAIGA